MSHFLLALADRRPDEGPPGPAAAIAAKFSVFCKVCACDMCPVCLSSFKCYLLPFVQVGSGYNVDELIQLQNLLSPHWTE